MRDPAADTYVTLRGLRFHYREYGAPASPPIVLLHGVASNARIWIATAPLLADRFHVLALDQRGHGESDKPDTGYDFPTVAGDLAALIDELALDRPVIVGHSWGGNVAVAYTALHPERPAGLVLVDGGTLEPGTRMSWEQAEREMAPPELTHLTRDDFMERIRRRVPDGVWTEEVEAAIMGNFDLTEAGTIRPRLSRANHMQVVRAMWEQRLTGLWEKIRCPVLLIMAERAGDKNEQEWMNRKREGVRRAQRHIARSEVRWFRDTIHDVPLQRPAELAQAIGEFVLEVER